MSDYGDYFGTYSGGYNLDNFSDTRRRSGQSRPRSGRTTPRMSQRRTSPAAKKPASAVKRTKPSSAKKAVKAAPQKPVKTVNRHAASGRNDYYRVPKKPAGKGKKFLITLIVLLIVGGILAGAGVVGYNMYMDFRKGQPFRFSNAVKISGIDIGGLSYEEAEKKVKKESMSVVKNISLKVSANDVKKSYGKKDFKYKFDYASALREAKVYSLKEQGIYEEKTTGKNTEPETEFVTMENPDFKLDYSVDKSSIENQVRKLALNVNRDAENAKVSKFTPFAEDKFEYKRGTLGYSLDKEYLNKKINKFFSIGKKAASIQAKVETIYPDITIADLEENIVGLATETSVSNNTEAGTHNMAVALKACNGSIIEPGELWSFNECTGDSNKKENGYKEAVVISEKKLDKGIGGGICQASTTIFKAAAMANMDVVERHNHYWASGYAYSGEDATIDYPNLDLRLRNTTDYQMFIESKVDGRTLIVNIYGYQEPYYDNVSLRSFNYDINKGRFFRAKTMRTLYKDHEVVSDDLICTSYYSLTENHTVRDVDKGTFRTKVNGTVIYDNIPKDPETETTPDTDSETVTESE